MRRGQDYEVRGTKLECVGGKAESGHCAIVESGDSCACVQEGKRKIVSQPWEMLDRTFFLNSEWKTDCFLASEWGGQTFFLTSRLTVFLKFQLKGTCFN